MYGYKISAKFDNEMNETINTTTTLPYLLYKKKKADGVISVDLT